MSVVRGAVCPTYDTAHSVRGILLYSTAHICSGSGESVDVPWARAIALANHVLRHVEHDVQHSNSVLILVSDRVRSLKLPHSAGARGLSKAHRLFLKAEKPLLLTAAQAQLLPTAPPPRPDPCLLVTPSQEPKGKSTRLQVDRMKRKRK